MVAARAAHRPVREPGRARADSSPGVRGVGPSPATARAPRRPRRRLGREVEELIRPGTGIAVSLGRSELACTTRSRRRESAARPRPRVRNGEPCEHAALPAMAGANHPGRRDGDRLRLRIGYIAIAALKLGAARAAGIDIDPDAVAAAAANARRNGVTSEFFESGSLPAFAADVVVANILANPLKVLAPIIAERCRPGGHVALSGILIEQAADVESAYSRWLAFTAPEQEDGWVCLSGRRL